MRHARLLAASASLALALLIGGCSEGPITHPQAPRTAAPPPAADYILRVDTLPLITTLEDEVPLPPPDSTDRCGGGQGGSNGGRC